MSDVYWNNYCKHEDKHSISQIISWIYFLKAIISRGSKLKFCLFQCVACCPWGTFPTTLRFWGGAASGKDFCKSTDVARWSEVEASCFENATTVIHCIHHWLRELWSCHVRTCGQHAQVSNISSPLENLQIIKPKGKMFVPCAKTLQGFKGYKCFEQLIILFLPQLRYFDSSSTLIDVRATSEFCSTRTFASWASWCAWWYSRFTANPTCPSWMFVDVCVPRNAPRLMGFMDLEPNDPCKKNRALRHTSWWLKQCNYNSSINYQH